MENIALTEAVYYILLSLAQPLHGYGIMQNTEALSGGRIRLAAGTLYGALTSLLDKVLAIGMLNRLLGGILGTAKFALVLGTLIWLLSTTNLISQETMQTSHLCRPLKAMPEYTYNVIKKHAPQVGQEISTCLTRKKGMPNEQ